MKKKILPVTGMLILILACFSFCLFAGTGSTCYYSRIDNSRIVQGGPRRGVIDLKGGMDYYYTLPSYDENGREQDLTFGTSRQLREGAFIRLTAVPIRGVTEWSEVQYEELPEAVQSQYAHFMRP